MSLILQDVTNKMQDCTAAVWQGEATPIQDLTTTCNVPDHAWCEVAFERIYIFHFLPEKCNITLFCLACQHAGILIPIIFTARSYTTYHCLIEYGLHDLHGLHGLHGLRSAVNFECVRPGAPGTQEALRSRRFEQKVLP